VVICDSADEVIVRLQGEGGYLDVQPLNAALLPLHARRPALVTFDLSELHFISSLVLGVLVSFRRSAARAGGRVRLTALRPEVHEAIVRTGLATLLLEPDAPETGGNEAQGLTLANV
jgi:anti-anti-sigma factor